MQKVINLCIVIPCYNEAEHFLFDDYVNFLSGVGGTTICFVNDGSTDHTMQVLTNLKERHPKQVDILSLSKNVGKAEAVRQGVLYTSKSNDANILAYLDADLAVSLEECESMAQQFHHDIEFCFGSRILKIGSEIKRKWSRFIIGRIIATVVSQILPLKIYDTQCGCKLFSKKIVPLLFVDPFISKWLFDIEVFFRMLNHFGKRQSIDKIVEVPLKLWVDRGNSKVKASYFFQLWIDLYKIKKAYGNKALP